MKLLKPNKLKQALLELQAMGINDVPDDLQEIQESEKGYYVVIGIISKDNVDGTAKIHTIEKNFSNTLAWGRMQEQIKARVFKQPFGGKYNKVIMLNDPTIKKAAPKKVKKVEPVEPVVE